MAHFTNNGVVSGEPLFTKTMNPLLQLVLAFLTWCKRLWLLKKEPKQ
jgi:hypothetical protein